MPQGGYQAPAEPAAVSGPGSLSQRTDGQAGQVLPDAQYGEAKDFASIQSGAPMAQAPSASGGGGAPSGPPRPGFGDPTQRPDEPVTNGAAAGLGAGPEALGIGQSVNESTLALKKYMPLFTRLANDPSASKESRSLVQWLKTRTQE